MKKTYGRLLAAVLALVMVMGSVSALADAAQEPDPYTNPIRVEDGTAYIIDPANINPSTQNGNPYKDAEGNPIVYQGEKLEGSLTVEVSHSISDPSLSVRAISEDSAFEVTGTVTSSVKAGEGNINVDALAVDVSGWGKSAKATVGGADATAEITNPAGYVAPSAVGVKAVAYSEGESAVTVNGDAKAAVEAHSTRAGEGDNVQVIAYAVETVASSSAATSVTVNGDAVATAKAEGNEYSYVNAEAYAVNAYAEGEGAEIAVTVTGQATASAVAGENGTAKEVAVKADSRSKAQTTVTVGEGARGKVSATSSDGGQTTVKILNGGIVGGNVSAEKEEDEEKITGGALFVSAIDGSTSSAEVVGSIIAVNDAAVAAKADGKDAQAVLTLKGSITAKGDSEATGGAFETYNNGCLDIIIIGGTVSATLEENKGVALLTNVEDAGGDIFAENESGTAATGLYFVNGGGTINAEVEADVVATGADCNTGVVLEAPEKSNTTLNITGDVTADQIGLDLSVPDVQTADVIVDGTISAGEAGVVLRDKTKIGENLSLTVWEIVPNKENGSGVVFDAEEGKDGKTVYKENQDAEKEVNYIIKVEQPTEGGTLSVTDENGNVLTEKYGYETAKEGAKILLQVNIASGYVLTGAYNGKGEKVSLLKDSEGNYYVKVPKGGGVYLTASVEKEREEEKKEEKREEKKEESEIAPQPAPQPNPNPQPQPKPQPKPQPNPQPDEGATARVDSSLIRATPLDEFCERLTYQIRQAPENGKVYANASKYSGLKRIVFDVLVERSDVTLELTIPDGRIITFPAGVPWDIIILTDFVPFDKINELMDAVHAMGYE